MTRKRKKGWLVFSAGVAMTALIAGGLATSVHAGGAGKARPQEADDPGPRPLPNVKGIVVLFGGKEEDMKQNWHTMYSHQPANWKFVDGIMEDRLNDIESNEKFQDFQLHVEFREPLMENEHGQGRGNSGVFLHGHYEIQVLDSYGIADPGRGDCGAVYDRAAPLINACKPPLQWQTYDITFRAPRYENGQMTEKARVTVVQNGIVVQNNTIIPSATDHEEKPGEDYSKPVGIRLQYHHAALHFRNIWVLPLPEKGADHY